MAPNGGHLYISDMQTAHLYKIRPTIREHDVRMKAKEAPHAVAFVLLPEFANLGLAAAIEPLFIANWLRQRTAFSWLRVSVDGAQVRASNGMHTSVDGALGRAEDCQTVFILASFEPSQIARDARLVSWLKSCSRRGVLLAGIENGSFALAQAGLLNAQTAAIHWDNLTGFKELFPKVLAADQLYSLSDTRMTCAGGAAVIDMMLAWIRRDVDAELASEIARHLLLDRIRLPTGREARRSGHIDNLRDPLVTKARDLILACLDEPIRILALAKHVGLSTRQLQRRFRQELGHAVHREIELLRMERAHQYLQQTDMSVTSVAIACGFSSAEYFSRIYQRTFSRCPSADRRQSTDAPVFNRIR